jgi:hypothetical protein
MVADANFDRIYAADRGTFQLESQTDAGPAFIKSFNCAFKTYLFELPRCFSFRSNGESKRSVGSAGRF